MAYNVDIVMCIDCTGSMSDTLATVKANALKFYPDLEKKCKEKGKVIDQLRVKVIGFRDFGCDGEGALQESEFFVISDQSGSAPEKFQKFVNSLSPEGGGDAPEDSLEALAIAFNTDWVMTGEKQRHIVVLWTDVSAHPIGTHSSASKYPSGMPKSIDELVELWNNPQGKLSASAKRIVFFAPEMEPWPALFEALENALHLPTKAGAGCKEADYEEIISYLVNSIEAEA